MIDTARKTSPPAICTTFYTRFTAIYSNTPASSELITMLSRVSANLLATTSCTQSGALLTAQRLLRTTISSSSELQGTPGGGTGAPGSKGAAPGRAAGSDEQVKFGDADACKMPLPCFFVRGVAAFHGL